MPTDSVTRSKARRAWRDNSSALYWLGVGVAIGLLLPTLWVPGPLTQVTVGYSLLGVSVFGLSWFPIGDWMRRRVKWLPDPPMRPKVWRGFSTPRGTERPPLEEGDTWAIYDDTKPIKDSVQP